MKIWRRWRAKRTMLRVAKTMKPLDESKPMSFDWPCPLQVAFKNWPLDFPAIFATDFSLIYDPADRFWVFGREENREKCIKAIEALPVWRSR